jgi:hypothetical protein
VVALNHVETAIVPGCRLGLRPRDPDRHLLKVELTGAVPPHAATADHFGEISTWGMLGNDIHSDCGPAAVAHYVMLVTQYLTGTMVSPSLNDVYALYTLCNPTFNPTTGDGDNGVDMGEMLGFVCTNGIGGKRALAYATVEVDSIDAIRAVAAIFGGALLGVGLQKSQQSQTKTGGPWDYQPSQTWGGHAVLAGLYSSNTTPGQPDISVITWGAVMGTTDAFAENQVQTVDVLIFPEHLGSVAFQQGVDLVALAANYQALTGQPFPAPLPTPPNPAPVPPGPTPTPPPAPGATVTPAQTAANAALAAEAHQFIQLHHVLRGNVAMEQELQRWLQVWSL